VADEDIEREEMPVDVLFVGAGPANLAASIHLMNLIEAHNAAVESGEKEGEELDEPMIAVLEKGSRVGAHQLSGAILDPRALAELIPDWKDREDFPVERYVEREEMVFLTNASKIKAPWLPKELINHGKPIVSLGRLCEWLGEIAEEKGVNIFPEFAGAELLWDEEVVVGVRTGDKGIDAQGEPTASFEPGMDLTSPVTILGEGPRGYLAKQLIAKKQLDKDCNPMTYEVGCKEIIELPEGSVKDGFCIHGMGFPLDTKTFGGFFMYTLEGDKAAVGMMVSCDAPDPMSDCHLLLQQLKTHPYIKSLLGKGKVVKYGAKTVTMGGWASVPQLYTDGAMIVGDSASFLNPMRIKGIHLSMKSGMLAAETAFEAMLSGDASAGSLKMYSDRLNDSWIRTEMEKSKNFHVGFKNGLFGGMFNAGLQFVFGPGSSIKPFSEDHKHMRKISTYGAKGPSVAEVEFDGTYLVDKLTDVYHSGTQHDEHQPAHLHIADTNVCATKCLEEYGNPCTKFCPAQVYNMVESGEGAGLQMQVDFSNCVHCKTCDIRDPYQIITWVPPQGGDGPEYGLM